MLKTIAEMPAALAARKRSHGSFQAVWEEGVDPSLTRILRRGDWAAPLASVAPGFPAALCQPGQAELVPAWRHQGRLERPAAGAGAVADCARPSARRPGCWSIGSGSTISASASWPRRTIWAQGRTAVASRAARLAGGRSGRTRLAAETSAQIDHDIGCLSPVVESKRRRRAVAGGGARPRE